MGKKNQVKFLPGIFLCLIKIHIKKKKATNKPKPHISTRLTPLPEELFEAALACTVITCSAQAGAEAQVYLIAISERATGHKGSSLTSPGTAQLTSTPPPCTTPSRGLLHSARS